MFFLPAFIVMAVTLFTSALAHSQMTQPQATSQMHCRLGGDPNIGVEYCPGPCDLRAIEGGWGHFDSPDNPAATYGRGEKVLIKYARNNHGPGGFVRLTLVRPEDMMNKEVHRRNAFYYSCWGARPVEAAPEELVTDEFGFGFIGSDGRNHDFPRGYYVTEATIPTVVPDGKYVLGWVWYGGVGGEVKSMEPQEPLPYGYFGDYWSCSFVEILGGASLEQEYSPVFNNDMAQFSDKGCMSANDDTGICTYEPCNDVVGDYQVPRQFKEGTPPSLKPALFAEEGTGDAAVSPEDVELEAAESMNPTE